MGQRKLAILHHRSGEIGDMIELIGISGPMGSGKTTVAGYLRSNHGFIVYKFAQPLRMMLGSLLWSACMTDVESYLEGDKKDQPCEGLNGHTPRHAMQTLGTEWGRNHLGKDIWVEIAKMRLHGVKGRVVFDDVRFENEATMIRQMGGKVWHMVRESKKDGHVSENGILIDIDDIVLSNTLSLGSLFDRVDALM